MNVAALRDLLIAWAEINSGSDHVAGLERMRAALEREFSRLSGAEIETVILEGTTARALRVRLRPDATRQILLSGHFDTVYSADHPFQRCTVLDEQRLRGPGVADMKGGLVLMLAALQELERSPHARNLGFEILLTPDEETGSTASRPLLEAAARSGRFAFGLVFEPARANGNLVRSRAGTGTFMITCHGRAAHAGRDPAAGRNAILALADYLPKIDALNRELDGVLLNVGNIRGGSAVNIVPDLATAGINLRIIRASDEVRVRRRLQELADPINAREGFRLEISGGFNRPPKEAGPTEAALFAAWQKCGRDLGMEFTWEHVNGGSDGNLLSAAGLPTLDGLGPVGDRTHSPEEFVLMPSLAARAALAARFLERYAAGEIILPPRQ